MKHWIELGLLPIVLVVIIFPGFPWHENVVDGMPGDLSDITKRTPCNRILIDRRPYRGEPQLVANRHCYQRVGKDELLEPGFPIREEILWEHPLPY